MSPKSNKNAMKAMILGTEESGKNTFLKQIKVALDPEFDGENVTGGYTTKERKHFVKPIISDLFQCLKEVHQLMGTLNIKYALSSVEAVMKAYSKDIIKKTALKPDDIMKVKSIMTDEAIVKLMKDHEHNQPIFSRLNYFVENIDRIGGNDYVPTNVDILNCHSKACEHSFNTPNTQITFLDFGNPDNWLPKGSPSKKWVGSCKEVECVIFFASLDDYNLKTQATKGKEEANKMRESMSMFAQVVNQEALAGTLIVLLLNKHDSFVKKLETVDFEESFPEYKAWREAGDKPKTAESCLECIQDFYQGKFELALTPKIKGEHSIICHKIVATDTKMIIEVFTSIKQGIVEAQLKKSSKL